MVTGGSDRRYRAAFPVSSNTFLIEEAWRADCAVNQHATGNAAWTSGDPLRPRQPPLRLRAADPIDVRRFENILRHDRVTDSGPVNGDQRDTGTVGTGFGTSAPPVMTAVYD